MKVRLIKEAFKKTICSVVSTTMLLAPTWAFGGETNMSTLGKEAQGFGEEIGTHAAGNMPTLSGNELQFKDIGGKDFSMSKDELNSKSENVKYQYDEAYIDKIKGYYTDGDKLTEYGESEKKNLYQNATSDEPTVEGHAYAVVKDLANMQKQDLSKDKMFDQTQKILGSIKDFAEGLGECKSDTEIIKNTTKTHIPDYKLCSQVMDRSGACTIFHNYRAGVVQHYDGPYNFESCGKGCTRIWLGKVGNNYIHGGSCSLHTEELLFKVTNPDAITRAEIDYAAYDDQMQIWIGERGKEQKFYQGPRATFPYYDDNNNRVPGVACELSTHWIWDPTRTGPGCTESSCAYTQNNLRPISITHKLKEAGKGGIVRFFLRDAIGGEGEAFARLTVYYDPAQAIHDESWTPISCIEAALGVEDGFAKGNVRCTDMPSVDGNGCSWIDGVHVCPSDLSPSPIKVPNLCKRAEVYADFDFYKGQMECWTDVYGNRICPNNQGGNLDSCKKYADDKKCGFIKSECVGGAVGKSGQCYVTDVTYDCGEDIISEDVTEETTYKCPGDVSCMGNDCVDTSIKVNKDLGKVMALMNAAQYMTQDMVCTGQDADGNVTGEENVTCSVFGGEAGECKIAVGGVADCCESVDGIGLADYIAVIKAMSNMTSALSSMELTSGLVGSAKDYIGSFASMGGEASAVIKEGVSWISKPFSSFVGNIGGAVDKVTGPVEAYTSTIKETLMKKCEQALTKMFEAAGFPSGGAGAGAGATAGEAASNTAEKAASATMEACGTMFTVISWAYTAYVVAKMVIQLVYKCTEEEYEIVSQRDLKQCHYVGSYCRNKKLGVCIEKRETYCCYASPLSRIMNEQIRKQGDAIGPDFNGFGTAKHPRCDGIPLEKIDKIDWNRVDLSEWISILKLTNNYPTDELLNMEKLTGKGNKLDLDGNRLNTVDRTLKRFEDLDGDGLRIEGAQEMDVDVGALP